MSRRRAMEARIRSLHEVRDILAAMKNMARMELTRLSRFRETQQRVVASIEAAAADFQSFHVGLFPDHPQWRDVHVVIGSERGFCGDFNESLFQAVMDRFRAQRPPQLVVLGAKLHLKLADAFPDATLLESAGVADEVEKVLLALVDAVSRPQDTAGFEAPLRVTVFHHQAGRQGVQTSVLAPFSHAPANPGFPTPPLLYAKPEEFLRGLMETYLIAKLQELLNSSLAAENQTRMDHLESAVQRLDGKTAELVQRRNMLRQEEITEEIEVIMLSAGVDS